MIDVAPSLTHRVSSHSQGTAIFNLFTLQNAKLAALSGAFTTALGAPCVANVYVTGPGRSVSARIHNDLQALSPLPYAYSS